MCSHVIPLGWRLKVRVCPGALDDLFDRFLHQVPVGGVNTSHFDLEVILDLHEHLPAFLVVDEADGDTDTPEAAGTTDTVQIGLRVGLALDVVRNVLERLASLGYGEIKRTRERT